MLQARVNTISKIIREINDYMVSWGGNYRDWYVGIASNPRDRLFNDHNVNEKTDAWIYRDAGTSSAARQVETYFLNLGCQGGSGGDDYTTRYAYAYKINSHTVE